MLVSCQDYPNIRPAEDWLRSSFEDKVAVLRAVDQSFRMHSIAIHPDDEMWRGLEIGQKDNDSKYLRVHYFFGGRSAMKNIAEALISSEAKLPKRILDFPCSHGRVTRFLRTAFPDAELFVGDVNHPGVDFCCAAFDAKPVYSKVDLSEVEMPGNLDLIWCSSLATHLPENVCHKLFNCFFDALAPGGIVGITTCGRGMDYMQRSVYQTIPPEIYERIYTNYKNTGFGYQDYPGHNGYGMTFVDLRWIQKLLFARDDLYILSFSEKAWHGAQDILWLVKRPISHWYNWATAS